ANGLYSNPEQRPFLRKWPLFVSAANKGDANVKRVSRPSSLLRSIDFC
ncbi:MAG: hypothetical protein ACI89U_002770, partial [Gammaproteobacteria bacterium]